MNRADVMTVREMIDSSVIFDGDCSPIVDFKMIESVLYIIARHMNILQRHFLIEMRSRQIQNKSLSVNEIKVHAMTLKKKKKGKPGQSPDKSKKSSKKKSGKSLTDTSEDHHGRKSESKSRSRSHSKKRKDSDTTEMKYHKKKSRSRSRARSLSKKQKEFIRSDPSDTSDDHHRRKRSRSRRRSRSRSKSEKRKHYRSRSGKSPVFTSHDNSGRGKRSRKEDSRGSRKTRSRDDEDEDSMEVLREKLLVVSRSSAESQTDHHGSVVTQSQFDDMVIDIRKLQAKFGMKDMFADSDTPWSNLHKPTSLTDPRAALNMAARLDVAEKKSADMLKGLTAFARNIPGIDIEKAFDKRFLPPPKVMGPSAATSKTGTSSTAGIGMKMIPVEEQIAEVELEEEYDRVTWEQVNDGLRDIREDMLRFVPDEASLVKTTAKKASTSLHSLEPKVQEAQTVNSKYVMMTVEADAFANRVTELDNILTLQMSDCQENLSQMQFDLEITLERIDDITAHPKEDPNAVAAIKEDFTALNYHLGETYYKQKDLAASHEYNLGDLKMIWKKLEILQRNKTTRDEVLEALKDKASLNDLNGLLAKEQFYAVIGYLQQNIVDIKQQVSSGEMLWQKLIDELLFDLYDRANRDQVETLNHSIHTYITNFNGKLKKILNVVGEYPVNNFKKKIERDGTCLCCGSPGNVKLPDDYMKVLNSMLIPEDKPPVVDESAERLCIPGLPIPHPLDPRALVCERYCGASINVTESLPSLFSLDILDLNPGKIPAKKSLTSVYLGDIKKPCTPCASSEFI